MLFVPKKNGLSIDGSRNSEIQDREFNVSGEFDEANIEKVARCMKALAHPLRLKVIVALSNKELSVQELVEAVGTTQSNVSQHLTIMRDKSILASRREANQVFYRVGDCKVLDLVALTRTIFCNSSPTET